MLLGYRPILYQYIVGQIVQSQLVEQVAIHHTAIAYGSNIIGTIHFQRALARALVGIKTDAYDLKLAIRLAFLVGQLA